jgi:hypothetical protein
MATRYTDEPAMRGDGWLRNDAGERAAGVNYTILTQQQWSARTRTAARPRCAATSGFAKRT